MCTSCRHWASDFVGGLVYCEETPGESQIVPGPIGTCLYKHREEERDNASNFDAGLKEGRWVCENIDSSRAFLEQCQIHAFLVYCAGYPEVKPSFRKGFLEAVREKFGPYPA